jgi:1-acyl-sn-glycerol-3-phosphate acyltransferase
VSLVGRPTARASLAYRGLRLFLRLLGAALFRVRVSGLENLPRDADGKPIGGWICCGLPHRTWVEPMLLVAHLPAEPRMTMLGDGATMFGSRWRSLLVRFVGGVVPIWPGAGVGSFRHIASAAGQVIGAGGVLALFPETGPPSRPPNFRRLSPGVVRLAQQAGAPIVPVVFGGTHELYLRRHIVVRVLPAIEPPSAESGRRASQQSLAELDARAQEAGEEAHRAAEARAPRCKRWRWLTGPYPSAD